MGFMKKGTSVAQVRQVGLKEWGLTKTASVNNQEEQERKAAEASRKGSHQ